MGHVPPGAVPPTSPGSHLPRRQRRAVGEAGVVPLSNPHGVGEAGERLARWYLEERGLGIIASNVVVDGGEIDLLARDGRDRVAVEVRTRRGGQDPVDAIDPAKRARVARLARTVGATRCDVIGIRIGRTGLDLHWVPGAC